MSLFAKAQAAAQNVKVEEKDVLGGGSFTVESNVYLGGVKMAFIDAWASGSLFVNLELALMVDGKERSHKEIITISNKAGEFTYTDKKSGEKMPMPGYALVDELFKAVSGKGFNDQAPAIKGVKVYDKELKAEVIQDREVFMDLIGKKAQFGILENEVDKTTKDAMSGEYVPTGETRKENTLAKTFTESGKTLSEAHINVEPKFIETWKERYAGKLQMKAKGKGKSGVATGSPIPQTASASLFGA